MARTKKKTALEAKWGKRTIKQNYTVVPTVLLKAQARLKINGNELAVLIHLLDHWYNAENMPWPSRSTIAERMQTTEQTIRRHVKNLEEAGLVKRNPRFKEKGARTSNEYDLSGLVERLDEISSDLENATSKANATVRQATRPGLRTRPVKKEKASDAE